MLVIRITYLLSHHFTPPISFNTRQCYENVQLLMAYHLWCYAFVLLTFFGILTHVACVLLYLYNKLRSLKFLLNYNTSNSIYLFVYTSPLSNWCPFVVTYVLYWLALLFILFKSKVKKSQVPETQFLLHQE